MTLRGCNTVIVCRVWPTGTNQQIKFHIKQEQIWPLVVKVVLRFMELAPTRVRSYTTKNNKIKEWNY